MLRHIQNNFNKDNSDAQKLQYWPVIRQTSTNQNIMLQNTTMIYYFEAFHMNYGELYEVPAQV